EHGPLTAPPFEWRTDFYLFPPYELESVFGRRNVDLKAPIAVQTRGEGWEFSALPCGINTGAHLDPRSFARPEQNAECLQGGAWQFKDFVARIIPDLELTVQHHDV